ncbi:MAG: S8 family serine peptidase [Clostridia bacterium]|nr:S8 family serine peptidase [Clostridia bacterium]
MALRAQMQLEMKEELRGIGAEVVKVRSDRAKEVLDTLRKNPNVDYVEYDYIASIDYIPNDPYYPAQSYLPNMNTAAAWDITLGSPNVVIAVLDTGISSGNFDMQGNVIGGYNFISDNTNYADDNGHGTMVASVAAGITDNGYGIAGISGKSKLLAVKVMNSSGSGTYSTMIKGIEYAVSNGANVINMSIGGRTVSTALKLAVDNAISSGVTVVAAAGNEGSTSLSYPAAFENVIGVGAVDFYNNKTSYSNTGQGITLMAGGSARVATTTTYIGTASGTSFASPYVAGLVALMYSSNAEVTPSMIFDALAKGALDLGIPGYDTTFGYGMVDMGKSLGLISGSSAPLPVKDTIAPILSLNGNAYIKLNQGDAYEELGATAIDNIDGDISSSVQITGVVNALEAGVYNLTYTVADKAGNSATPVTRTIEVLEVSVIPPPDEPVVEEPIVEEPVPEEPVGEEDLIELEPDTQMVRDIEVVKGTINKKSPLINHVIKVVNPGQLDVDVSYVAKVAPDIKISGLNFTGTSGTFDVTEGDYIMSISSSSNVNFTATITYPEREVPVDIPLGVPETIIYGKESNTLWYIYLGATLLIFVALGYLYKTKHIRYNKNT